MAAKAEQEEADGSGSDDSVHEVCKQVTKANFHLTMLEQATSREMSLTTSHRLPFSSPLPL